MKTNRKLRPLDYLIAILISVTTDTAFAGSGGLPPIERLRKKTIFFDKNLD